MNVLDEDIEEAEEEDAEEDEEIEFDNMSTCATLNEDNFEDLFTHEEEIGAYMFNPKKRAVRRINF